MALPRDPIKTVPDPLALVWRHPWPRIAHPDPRPAAVQLQADRDCQRSGSHVGT
jgi:hypothetical protein